MMKKVKKIKENEDKVRDMERMKDRNKGDR